MAATKDPTTKLSSATRAGKQTSKNTERVPHTQLRREVRRKVEVRASESLRTGTPPYQLSAHVTDDVKSWKHLPLKKTPRVVLQGTLVRRVPYKQNRTSPPDQTPHSVVPSE